VRVQGKFDNNDRIKKMIYWPHMVMLVPGMREVEVFGSGLRPVWAPQCDTVLKI
jgi:hypothetical protein